MKNIKILILAQLISLVAISGEIEVSSKITNVTVFLSGANVNRTASINIPKGKSEIHFSSITPLLAKESIQVKGIGDFTILSVNYQTDNEFIEAPESEVASLIQKMEDLNVKMEEIRIKTDVYAKEIILIENTSQTSKNSEIVNLESIKSTQNYYHTTLLDLKLGKLKLERELKSLYTSRIKLQQQLNAFKIKKTATKSIIKVIIKTEKALSATFEISYFVTNAKWYPEYDVRVKNVSSPLTLNYKANISQQTGEDWENVNLTISTSNPNKSNRKPILNKWLVDLYGSHVNNKTFETNYLTYTGRQFAKVSGIVTDQFGEPLPFVNVTVEGSSTGATTDFDGRFLLTPPKGANQLKFSFVGYNSLVVPISNDEMRIIMEESQELMETVEITTYKAPLIDRKDRYSSTTITRSEIAKIPGKHATSTASTVGGVINMRGAKASSGYYYIDGIKVRGSRLSFEQEINTVDVSFTAEEKYTINSNSKYQVVALKRLNIPAHYLYYSAPKLDKGVFLTAQIVGWEKYNLLEGQVSIYFEGTYMGSTVMDVKFTSDTLNLSIGRDKNVVVQREKIKELSSKKVFGSSITNQKSWKMQVKNNKNVTIDILIEDQFPISTNKQVIVKHEETNSPKVDKDKGLVSWKFDGLAPSEKKEMELKFSVKYPTFVEMMLE